MRERGPFPKGQKQRSLGPPASFELRSMNPSVNSVGMSDVTRLLDAAAAGDRHAAGEILPLVYDELRRLAAARLTAEPSGQTLQPTALVHEAYLRLVGQVDAARWETRGHFFAAAAEAMRRIVVETARRKKRAKHGGGRQRVEVELAELPTRLPRTIFSRRTRQSNRRRKCSASLG